ncbi:MAG: hypothetical protein HYW49_13240 [Deltaproteobacteria bacterium]|nr:hypothetical protein [Deltaproteobacteria bacterium]
MRAAPVLILALVSLGIPRAHADKFDTSATTTARALGMGNAVINTERGGMSVFHNPANIAAKDTGSVFQIVNFSLEANEGLVTQSQKGGSINFANLSTFYETMNGNKNNYAGGRYSLYPNLTIRNLSFGVLYERNRAAMVRETDGAFIVRAKDRFAPTAALSFRLFAGIFRIGIMAQYLTVGEADSTIAAPVDKSQLDWNKVINSRGAITKTGGVTLTLPMRYLPSFSFVARDIGGTTFNKSPLVPSGTGRNVEPKKMTYDLATSFTVYLSSRIETRWEVDYRDVLNRNQGNRMRHIFAGTEMDMFNFLHFRAGYMHGWPAAGLGVGTAKANINFAWYSDEVEDRLRAFRDTRYVLQYTHSLFGGK